MRVALQLHPDWPYAGGSVLEALALAGRYRSQFETGTSNGGLTAHAGGDRWRWESRLFAGRYDDAAPAQRPVYGALHRGEVHGPAPRFGSAHLVLRPEVTARCTFCYPDSVLEPDGVVGPTGLDGVLAAWAVDDPDALDAYVEAHVHGGVVVAEDVEAVVLDPCFAEGAVHEAARRLGVAVRWHPGFVVEDAGSLDPAYRGPEHVALAVALAAPRGGRLTPDLIGDAARAGLHDPQALKRVWHLLARFGRDEPPGSLHFGA